MKKFLPLIAALAFVGCAEEPAEVPVVETPAEVITPPADTMDAMMDDTMMEDTMMTDDTMMEGEMMEDTTSTM